MQARRLLPFLWRADQRPEPRFRDQAEDGLGASYEEFSKLVLVGVYSCDATGVIEYYNNRAAELWGRRPADGESESNFYSSFVIYRVANSRASHFQFPMADVLSGKRSGVYDAYVQIERPDGSGVTVILNSAPLVADDGSFVGGITDFYDVNDFKDMKS